MPEFTITSSEVLGICTAIGVIWATFKIVVEIVNKFKSPNDDLRNKVEAHDKMLDNDNKRLKEIEEANKVLCKSTLALINHEITGNGVENMKKARDDLQQYLIER